MNGPDSRVQDDKVKSQVSSPVAVFTDMSSLADEPHFWMPDSISDRFTQWEPSSSE